MTIVDGNYPRHCPECEGTTRHLKDVSGRHVQWVCANCNTINATSIEQVPAPPPICEATMDRIRKNVDKTLLTDAGPDEIVETFAKLGGWKADSGKLPLHLLPFDALCGVAEILDLGAKKYAARNWEKGLAWDRVYSAALRHLFSWFQGEDIDPETGLSHMDHALCGLLFLSAFIKRGAGEDNRPSRLAVRNDD